MKTKIGFIVLGLVAFLLLFCVVRINKQNTARQYSKLIEYRIKNGETIHSIANNNDYIVQVIYENNLDYFDNINHSIDHIHTGDVILVPVYDN